MPSIIRASAVVTALMSSACSHIPDPVHIPGVDPFRIIQRVRCETRQVIESRYSTNNRLLKSSIGYGLTLTAEENSKKSAALGLHWPIPYGPINLTGDAGAERQRKNQSITEVVEDIKNTMGARCEEDEQILPTGSYPIVGKIGMDEIIRQFVTVNTIGPTTLNTGFQRTLTFRLKFNAGAAPSFVFVTALNPLIDGSLMFSDDREDLHVLQIAMSPPQPEAEPKVTRVYIENFKELATGARIQGLRPGSDQSRKKTPGATSDGAPKSSTLRSLSDTLRNSREQRQFQDFIREELR